MNLNQLIPTVKLRSGDFFLSYDCENNKTADTSQHQRFAIVQLT